MNKLRIATRIATLSALVVSSGAMAISPQRTFVASNGNDANPCSITAPCRSFTTAIGAVAVNGEVIVLDSAGYGSFTINKAVSVVAPAGVYAGIAVFAATDGVVINAGLATVALRGLIINGQGGNRGIVVTSASSVHIDDCTISNVGNSGLVLNANANVEISGTVIRNVGLYGILMNNGRLTAAQVQVRETGDNGIYITNGTAVIRDSIVTKTGAEGVMVQADTGNISQATVERTTVTNTSYEGIFAYANGGTSSVVAVDNVVSDNGSFSGIVMSGTSATMRASGNTVTRVQGWGLLNDGGTLYESAQDNFVQGNGGGPTNGTITNVGKF